MLWRSTHKNTLQNSVLIYANTSHLLGDVRHCVSLWFMDQQKYLSTGKEY